MQLKAGSSVFLALTGLIITPFAEAHIVTTETMGLISGIVHPLTGADHILAAVAAGLWAAVSDASRARSVITAFLGMLGLGVVAGFAGAPLSLAEPVIALSVITLGVLIALRVSLPGVAACTLAGAFALFHGYAHAAGLPVTGGSVWYLLGLLLTTAVLLGSGAALGRWLIKSEAWIPLRLAGGVVALIGSLLLATA
jgi:urease accessory protein